MANEPISLLPFIDLLNFDKLMAANAPMGRSLSSMAQNNSSLISIIQSRMSATFQSHPMLCNAGGRVITIFFTQPVKLQSIVMRTRVEGDQVSPQAPKSLMVLADPIQYLDLTSTHSILGTPLDLAEHIQYSDITPLTIFITSTHGVEELARIDVIDLIGVPLSDDVDMTEIRFEQLMTVARYRLQHARNSAENPHLQDGLLCLREAIEITPHDHPQKADRLDSLSVTLLQIYQAFEMQEHLDQAISYMLTTLQYADCSNKIWKGLLINLGNAYQMKNKATKDLDDLLTAIAFQHEALDIVTEGDINRGLLLSNMGTSYESLFTSSQKKEDINSAIDFHKRSIAATSTNEHNICLCRSNLGRAYLDRYRKFDDPDDLKYAIIWSSKSVENVSTSHRDLSLCLNNLGVCLSARFRRYGQVSDIDDSVSRFFESIKRSDPYHPNFAEGFLNVGEALRLRFEHLGIKHDLDRAILCQRLAIGLAHPGRASFAKSFDNLGSSYTLRYQRFEDTKDIEQAIQSQVETVRLTHPHDRDSPWRSHNLACSLLAKFEVAGHPADLGSAIDEFKRALNASADTNKVFYVNYAAALYRRFVTPAIGSDRKDIDMAIYYQQQAVDATGMDHPLFSQRLADLGNSYMAKHHVFLSSKDLEQGLIHLRSATQSANSPAFHRLRALCALAHADHVQNKYEEALVSYEQAIGLLDTVIWIGLDAETKLYQSIRVSEVLKNLASDAAACSIELAELHPQKKQFYLERSIELLDRGRSIMWSQAMNFRAVFHDVLKQDQQLADELMNYARVLNHLTFRDSRSVSFTEAEGITSRRIAEEWEICLKRVRDLPGLEHFLHPKKYQELRKAAKQGHIVIINSSASRLDAMIIHPVGDIVLIPFAPEITAKTDQIIKLLNGLSQSVEEFDLGKPSSFDDHLNDLWFLIGRKIVKHLPTDDKTLPLVWWCLTGPLTFLPIHACHPPPTSHGNPRKGMMEKVVSSYIPTVSTLLHAQQRRDIANSMRDSAISISVVAQPDGTDGYPALPSARQEIEKIQALPCEVETIMGAHATRGAVLDALERHPWIHLACHAEQESRDPMKSSFILHDGPLDMTQIALRLSKSAGFAFLSACQSGRGSTLLPDEAVHIAASLLFIGFSSVAATMWSVRDRDCPPIVERFYKLCFPTDGPNQSSSGETSTARALHAAIQNLRQSRSFISASQWIQFIHIGL